MKIRLLSFSLLALAFCAATPRAEAGIPIIWGDDDTITKLADLPAGNPAVVEMGPGTAVGYKYSRFHIYWCDLWTWNGEFVLYRENSFAPLGHDAKMAAVLAGVPGLHKPFLYYVPLGWILIGGAVAIGIANKTIQARNSPAARAAKLLKQPDYQEAAKIVASRPDGEAQALDFLTGRGIDPAKARANLGLVVHYLIATADRSPQAPPQAPPEEVAS